MFIFVYAFISDNYMDEKAFMLIDMETIKELIKPVDPRMEFLSNLNKLKSDKVYWIEQELLKRWQ